MNEYLTADGVPVSEVYRTLRRGGKLVVALHPGVDPEFLWQLRSLAAGHGYRVECRHWSPPQERAECLRTGRPWQRRMWLTNERGWVATPDAAAPRRADTGQIDVRGS